MQELYSDYLAHHGVKGQKWGERRFQNEDGTLTAAGEERYGNSKDYGDKGIMRKTVASEYGNYAFAKWRERRHEKNLNKAKADKNDKRINKYQSKLDAQKAANRNLDAYRRHTKTGTLVFQNAAGTAVGGLGGSAYRHARARGSSRIASMIEAGVPGVGTILRMRNDKKAYGKYIVYDGMKGESL